MVNQHHRGGRIRPSGFNGYSTLPGTRPSGDIGGLTPAGGRIRKVVLNDGGSQEAQAPRYGQDSARSKENETIRRASQHSGTDLGLTSEGFLSHGDNSPAVGRQKMLLPQYKNTLEPGGGRTESQFVGPSRAPQKQAAKGAKYRPKTHERKQRGPPAQVTTRAVKLNECLREEAKLPPPTGNGVGDLVRTQHYATLHKEPITPAYLPPEPVSPAFSPIRRQGQTLLLGAGPDEDGQSTAYGSALRGSGRQGTGRLRSGTLEKKGILREASGSPDSPALPLQEIVRPELIMRAVAPRATQDKSPEGAPEPTPEDPDAPEPAEPEPESGSGPGSQIADRYRGRLEHRKPRLPVSFLKQQQSYNLSLESQRAKHSREAATSPGSPLNSRSPRSPA